MIYLSKNCSKGNASENFTSEVDPVNLFVEMASVGTRRISIKYTSVNDEV